MLLRNATKEQIIEAIEGIVTNRSQTLEEKLYCIGLEVENNEDSVNFGKLVNDEGEALENVCYADIEGWWYAR